MLQPQSNFIQTPKQLRKIRFHFDNAKRLAAASFMLSVLALTSACQSTSPASSAQPIPVEPPAQIIDSLTQHSLIVEPSAESAQTLAHDKKSPFSAPEQWENQVQAHFNNARVLVEQELDTDLSDTKLMLVSDKPINREVEIETRRLVHNQFNNINFAEQFLAQVMHSQSGTYAALFSARLDAVMVSRRMLRSFQQSLPEDPDIRDAALLTLLIHELVHAADDKRYKIHENRALSFRASFAQSATFEGHAQWVTRKICALAGCLPGLDALDNFMFSRNESNNQLTQPVEAISRNVLEYSYIEGERFVGELAKRDKGQSLIDKLLATPPQDPVQILDPESYPDIARDRRNERLIRASTDIDHPWVAAPWVGVETSPLKGINLRAEPMRRKAAVDGFTRLIHAMVAMQFYDQHSADSPPVEVTLLQAESSHTAKLFASTLHQNTFQAEALVNDEPLKIQNGAGTANSLMNMHLYRTQAHADPTALPYRTAIAVSGPYVVQIAGNANNPSTLDDYAIRVLLNLQLSAL